MTTAHFPEGESEYVWFRCPDCPYESLSIRHYQEHIATAHPDEPDDEPDDTCHCGHPECGAC